MSEVSPTRSSTSVSRSNICRWKSNLGRHFAKHRALSGSSSGNLSITESIGTALAHKFAHALGSPNAPVVLAAPDLDSGIRANEIVTTAYWSRSGYHAYASGCQPSSMYITSETTMNVCQSSRGQHVNTSSFQYEIESQNQRDDNEHMSIIQWLLYSCQRARD